MPQLVNFPIAQQATPNSCWASAARAINNWYVLQGQSGANPNYGSDQALATAWSNVSHNPVNADITIQQSAAAALGDLGYANNIDDHALPSQAEITDSITHNQPLLAIVGDAPPNPNPDINYQNGHWVVIVGISANQANIDVFDPADGLIHTVAFNANTYQAGVYWQNTSYVDAHP